MSEYPILVSRYTGDQALTIRCVGCAAEAVIDADDILNDGTYRCPAGCPAYAEYKFAEADPCANCKKLGHWDRIGGRLVCSRVCLLQLEYTESLKASSA